MISHQEFLHRLKICRSRYRELIKSIPLQPRHEWEWAAKRLWRDITTEEGLFQ